MTKAACRQGYQQYRVIWALCCLFLLSGNCAAKLATQDKLVILLSERHEQGAVNSARWLRQSVIAPLADDLRVQRLVYSIPYCDGDQADRCEDDTAIPWVVEVYGRDLAELATSLLARHRGLSLSAYHVTERQPRTYSRTWPLGEATPGVRLVALMVKRDHLSSADFEAYWHSDYTPLALAQPISIWNYLQDVVVRCEGSCSDIAGIAFEQYRDSSGLTGRWLQAPWAAVKAIWSASKFMDSIATRAQLMTEFVIKDYQDVQAKTDADSLMLNPSDV